MCSTADLERLLTPEQIAFFVDLLRPMTQRGKYGDIRFVIVDGEVQTIKHQVSYDVRRMHKKRLTISPGD